MSRDDMKPIFTEYRNRGGEVSPMNTEPCKKYLQEKISEIVTQEDVLWLFYHIKSH